MKLVNDYIDKFGGPDKMIRRLASHVVVADAAVIGLLVGSRLKPMDIYGITIITLCFVIIALAILALVSELKEKADKKEQGNGYDGKDIEAGMIGGIKQMLVLIALLVLYAIIP